MSTKKLQNTIAALFDSIEPLLRERYVLLTILERFEVKNLEQFVKHLSEQPGMKAAIDVQMERFYTTKNALLLAFDEHKGKPN